MTIEYDDALEAEIRAVVEANPRNYVKVLRSKGFKGRCPDRTRLVEYVYACTPMLDNAVHTFKTRLYWTLNRLRDFPTCGNDSRGVHGMTRANVKKLKDGYPAYCDSKCQHEAPAYHEAARNAIKEKYGVDNAFQIPGVKAGLAARKDEIQAKRDATRREHFGDAPGWNLSKSVETRRQKYGSAWNQAAVRKSKASAHGDPNWNNPEKNAETKRANGTFNSSKPEKIIAELFKIKFGEVKTQYSSDEYPYSCDIFIPSMDMFVEYNGTWTHGGHPYDCGSEADAKRLAEWKSKNTAYYKNAIENWTMRDVEKRNMAKSEGLNYVELWNMDDVRVFLGMSEQEFNDAIKTAEEKITTDRTRRKRKHDAEEMYALHGREAFDAMQKAEFPYVSETDASAKYELSRLASEQTKDQTPSRLIRSFHRSMFSCRRKGMPSPVEYWETFRKEEYFASGEWRDFYVNRFVYAESKEADALRETGMMGARMALDGFTITHRADCVSYLKPMLAKRLASKYLAGCAETFCPFSGFSGIMLGTAVGLGMRFVGRDLNGTQVEESRRLAEYVRSLGFRCDAALDVTDAFGSSGEYESLFCCPPYEDLEMWNFGPGGECLDRNMPCDDWMDLCLANFKCRRYLFVVDDRTVGRYADRVVETLGNRSHFGENREYVVLVER